MVDHSDNAAPDGVGALFSVDAADNAEVVMPESPIGIDQMWSTGSEDQTVHDGEVVDRDGPDEDPLDPWSRIDDAAGGGPLGGDVRPTDAPGGDAWTSAPVSQPTPPEHRMPPDFSDLPPPPIGASRLPPPSPGAFGVGVPGGGAPFFTDAPTPPGAPGAGGVFSARPVLRADDEFEDVDEPELVDDSVATPSDASPFSSGGSPTGFGGGGATSQSRVTGEGPAGGSQSDPWDAWRDPDPPPTSPGERRPGGSGEPVVPDPHDFHQAVARLDPDEIERARVPLTVCGALLERPERVRCVVTGQMLGCAAAVVLTDRRVLVVNERRWRPIVDIYDLGPDLNVRGRHDGHVAALSFSDDARLSMVDGIGEVELAVALAKATREPSSTDEHQSHEF